MASLLGTRAQVINYDFPQSAATYIHRTWHSWDSMLRGHAGKMWLPLGPCEWESILLQFNLLWEEMGCFQSTEAACVGSLCSAVGSS